ncbi:MAG: exodeoxyribonuclease VII small subunit [Lachnospiraceae bacterium]|nr:exodeoxyribonuclease VII small subunit [Lachnospiraceae bacterium]
MEEQKKEVKLEEAFEKLDEMLSELESPDISLEESFQVYQEGMKLLKQCNEIIDRVEKSVLKLNENGELEEFKP